MARNISPASLAKLGTRRGIEPILLVQIQWADGGPLLTYSDRTLPGIFGTLLEVTNLENVVNISHSSSSQSISIKFNDTNGHYKTIIDNNDIHKRPVSVLQWFEGLPYSEAFVLFQGEISSPIVWNEAARTLSFEVVSRLEDKEVGFSVEEGLFPFLPEPLVGKAWPLIFGTVTNLLALRIDEIPKGVTTSGTGVQSPRVRPGGQLVSDDGKIQFARTAAELWFRVALLAGNTKDHYRFEMEATGIDYSQEIAQFDALQQQYTNRGNQFLFEMQRLQREMGAGMSLGGSGQGPGAVDPNLEKGSVLVAGGRDFPQNTGITLNIGGSRHTGVMKDDTFNIATREHPAAGSIGTTASFLAGPLAVEERPVVTEYSHDMLTTSGTLGVFYARGGTPVHMPENYPIRYIAGLNTVTVHGVFAYRTFGEVKKLFQVPPGYYTIVQKSYGSILATQIEMPIPLSARNEGWEDDIYVTVTGAVGSNTVDVLTYLIQTYTNKGIDFASFNFAKAKVANFPSNFALTKRANIIQVLKEIAFQARCAIWLKDNVFYLKYLPCEDAVEVETINETDVLNGTMEISTTDTESLVTKVVALWRNDLSKDEPNKVILRSNVKKYGTHEQEFDWYIYDSYPLVEKAATFWLIRLSNTWKTLKLKVPLTKLKLETFDTVKLNFTNKWVANGPIKAIVESSQFDPLEWCIHLTIWVPVRFGEMEKYVFSHPGDLDVTARFPSPRDIGLGNPGSNGPGENAQGTFEHPVNRTLLANGGTGGAGTIGSVRRRRHWGTDTISDSSPIPPVQSSLGGIAGTIDTSPYQGQSSTAPEVTKNKQHQFKNFEQIPFPTIYPGAFPGKVVSGQNGTYQVEVYFEGFERGSRTVEVKQKPESTKIPADTWVTVCKTVYKDENGLPKSKLVMAATQSTSAFPGKVLGGGGDTYSVQIYPSGLSGTTETVSAKQLQLVSGDFIPANSWTLVTKIQEGSETKYYMQFPVWL